MGPRHRTVGAAIPRGFTQGEEPEQPGDENRGAWPAERGRTEPRARRGLGPLVDQLASELAGRVRVGKLNVDDNPATASRFGVRSIPTLLILRDGREVDRIVGAVPKQEIVRRLDAVL